MNHSPSFRWPLPPALCASRLALLGGAAAAALGAVSACAPQPGASQPGIPQPRAEAPAATRRVIVLAIDALNESRLRASLPPEATRAFRALVDGGACAASARPAFPSLTAPGHAALWTGAYGDVNGIAGNVQPLLPRSTHAITETGSGFSAAALRAEPLWVTAALAGVRTAGHHPTQSPGVPGVPAVDGSALDAADSTLRQRASSALRSPLIDLVNGYDERVADARVMTHASHPVRPAGQWEGLPGHDGAGAPPPLEASIPVGTRGDSLFVLFTGRGSEYTSVVVAPRRSLAAGAMARHQPVESAPIDGRELARHFSAPFDVNGNGHRLRTRVRLFELAPDASRYMLFLPGLYVTASNHEATRRAYDAAADGWVGNSASGLLASGAFGTPLASGGDGTAEQRWLETAELATRQSIAGARWMWTALAPQLMLDYFAVGDDTDHLFWGLVSPGAPGYDAARAARVQRVRAHAWSLVDARIAALHEMAREGGAAVVLSGDHGMRAYWRRFRPNVALAAAGLLHVDASGRADARRSRAVSPNGYWVSVNRTAWRDGTVSDPTSAAVIDSVVRVLAAVRDRDGTPIVTTIFRAAHHDSLGLGGPVGGDVYYELAPGYYYDAAATGPVADELPGARGGHGFPSVSPDMHTVFCINGREFAPRRIGQVRTIDVAPTVLEWLGVAPAVTVRGRSLLRELRR